MEITSLLSRMSDHIHVSRAFGPPTDHGSVTVVPVAVVIGGGGLGTGEEAPEEPGSDEPRDTGMGAGFGGVTWPLGVYVIEGDRVRWVPAVDVTRVVLAVIALLKVIVALRAGRRRAR